MDVLTSIWLLVQAITAGVLAGSADVVAQKLAGVKHLQFKRSLLLMVWTRNPNHHPPNSHF